MMLALLILKYLVLGALALMLIGCVIAAKVALNYRRFIRSESEKESRSYNHEWAQ